MVTYYSIDGFTIVTSGSKMPNPRGKKTMSFYGNEEDISRLQSALNGIKESRQITSAAELTQAVAEIIEKSKDGTSLPPGIGEYDKAIADACKVIVANARAMATTAAMSRQLADTSASSRIAQLEHQLADESGRAQAAEASLQEERRRADGLNDKLREANRSVKEFRRMADEERERADQFARDLHSLASRLDARSQRDEA